MNRVARRSVSIAILALLFSSVNLAFVGGAASAAVPTVSFVDYAQCSNDPPPSASTACPGGWINGILNNNNSHYAEDQVTPQRAEVSYPAGAAFAGATLTFRYQTKKGGINAYDSLATWNTTQTGADRSQGLNAADVVAGAASTLPMVADPLAAGHELGGRLWTMYGGSLTGSSAITHDCTTATTPCASDDNATVTVTYDVPASDSARTVQLLFGGHLAASTGVRGWGIGLGAGSVSGGPYHIKWDQADGASIGNRDNQIMSSAVLAPALEISKTADAATVTAGATIGFTVTVSNTGAGSANNVSMADTLPTNAGLSWTIAGTTGTPTCDIAAGVLTCTKASLASAANFTVHVTSPTTTATCGTVSNSASVSAGADGAGPASASIAVNCPDVSVAKSGNGPVVAGGTATFTITVTAGGPGSSSNVTLSDTLPAGTWSLAGADAASCTLTGNALSCDFGTLAQGSSRSITVSRATGESDCPNGIVNTATVNATGDTNSENNSATASIGVTCQPNVSIAKSGSATVSAGGTATFTIVVSAGGTGPSSNVAVSDTLPAGTWTLGGANAAECSVGAGALSCNFGTMASGTSKTVTLSQTTSAQDCPAIGNTATVTAAGDTSSADNSATASVVVNCASKLAIVKTADAASVAAGGTIGFVVTVTNNGNATATNVQLTDALPAGIGISWTIDAAGSDSGCAIGSGTLSCSFGSVAPAGSKHVHVTSPTSASSCGATYTNTATATADQNEPVAASATTSLQACPPPTPQSPQLSVSKTADAPFVMASAATSAMVGFTITVTNIGPVSTTATLTDTPVTGPNPSTPAGNAGTAGLIWTIDEAGSDSGCTLPLATLTCSFGTLAPGQSRHVHITAPALARTTAAGRNDNCGQRVDNIATVQFGGMSVQSNRATEDVNCILPTAAGRLTIVKFSDNNANAVQDAGEPNLAGWTFQVKNNATGDAWTVTTGANGQGVLDNLAFGGYTVTEVSCASPCDMARWIAIGHRIGTAAAVKDGKASATVAIDAADQSIAFGNLAPRLPSTSTLPTDEHDSSSLVAVLFAIILGQLAFLGRMGGHSVSTLVAFVRREEGQGLVEYALIIAIIAIAVIVAMIFLRDQISNIFSNIGNNLT